MMRIDSSIASAVSATRAAIEKNGSGSGTRRPARSAHSRATGVSRPAFRLTRASGPQKYGVPVSAITECSAFECSTCSSCVTCS